MKIKYRQRVFIVIVSLFVLLGGILLFSVINQEKNLKKDIFISDQIVYSHIVDEYITNNNLSIDNLSSLDNIVGLFPKGVRISILDEQGIIHYNSYTDDFDIIDSQRDKAEIRKALIKGSGWSTRMSDITRKESMFYAYHNEKRNYLISVALSFDDSVISFLSPNKTFLYFQLFITLLALLLFIYFYWYYQDSIKKFTHFINTFSKNKEINPSSLPDEWNEVALLIKNVYKQLEDNKKGISLEREKLLEHFQYSEEGISFFLKDRTNIYTNSHFIQYLNVLFKEPTFDVHELFNNPIFSEIVRFIDYPGDKTEFSTKIYGNNTYFFARVILFEDKSFEIIIRDITDEEKIYRDKAEMTNNIAHELKTPITSIRGYLETLIEHDHLPKDKKKEFIERAYNQTIRLSEIIRDVSLLSKASDARQFFEVEEVNIKQLLLTQINEDASENIALHKAEVIVNIPDNVIVKGNKTLLYSIFFNLGNNAIKYAGENITVTIRNYMEDENYYYFSFADNGVGLEEKHLVHIFEQFYRITEGRTRDKGGSGLGLAIVKEAVLFHNGTIRVKNREEGGLEYLFTLRKQ